MFSSAAGSSNSPAPAHFQRYKTTNKNQGYG